MKLKIIALALLCSMTTLANATTFPGYYVGTQFLGTNNTVTTNYAQSLYVGYQFSCFWAIEGGALTNFASNKDNRFQLYNFFGKGMIPFGTGFEAYAKAGLGYVTPGNSDNVVAPIASAGLSYDITPQIVVDGSFNIINRAGNMTDDITYWGVGVSYHFC